MVTATVNMLPVARDLTAPSIKFGAPVHIYLDPKPGHRLKKTSKYTYTKIKILIMSVTDHSCYRW